MILRMPLTFEKLSTLLGPFPKAVPLQPLTLEVVDRGTYMQEKVEYAVEEGERVRAYVLVPKERTSPIPAIFCYHRHATNWDLGKSEVVGLSGDPDMAYARELAERGFVAFAPDALMFEERNWAKKRQKVPTHANYLELAFRLLRGQTLLAKVLHDVRMGLDYLVTRPEVDESRLGFLGHSYGGRMALWTPVFDRRIKASVSNCGCDRYEDSARKDAGVLPEFCVPGLLNHGDMEDVVQLASHCNVLISATTQDRWCRGAEKIFRIAKKMFTDHTLELKRYEGGHAFTKPMREYAYQFLKTYLQR